MSQTLVKELCPAASRSTRYSGRPDIRFQARAMPGSIGTTVSDVPPMSSVGTSIEASCSSVNPNVAGAIGTMASTRGSGW